MPRTAKTIGFSVSEQMIKEVETLAKSQGMTKSEFFREMLRAYKQNRTRNEFFDIQQKISRRAQAMGIYTEAKIEKLINEER